MTDIQDLIDTLANHFISIIIPVYNDQNGLNRAIKKISLQTVPSSNFEVIVIDNNSKPPIKPCPGISLPYKIYSFPKPGSYMARNFGVKKSKGDILVFLDADCHPSPQWLEAGLKKLFNNNCSIVGGEVLYEKHEKPTAVEQYQYITGFGQFENISKKDFSATANLFTTIKTFNSIGFFNETLFSCGDREWCWRAKKAGFSLQFCSKAVVYTKARGSLRNAIVQTRRVVGGRRQMKQFGSLALENKHNIKPHKGPIEATKYIFSQKQISYYTRVKVFLVATFLKMVQFAEIMRLLCGYQPERR